MTASPMTAAPIIAAPWLIALDTATSVVIVAAGRPDGSIIDTASFAAEHRHGSHLLPTIETVIQRAGLTLDSLQGIVVGLGPGAFTGLRVGLATAKTLAHALEVPIVGVSTAEALIAAGELDARDAASAELLLPAGPHDRVRVVAGRRPALEAGASAPESSGTIAVDLPGRASEAALARGRDALSRLPATLLRMGAERLRSGSGDDAERLVPAYVSLPRGVTSEVDEGAMSWSHDRP